MCKKTLSSPPLPKGRTPDMLVTLASRTNIDDDPALTSAMLAGLVGAFLGDAGLMGDLRDMAS